MIVGMEPLSTEPEYPEYPAFRAPRAYKDPEEAELVSVVVARVVGIVDPGDHALDESAEGRTVRVYYEVPIVIGKRVPWIDNGSRRYVSQTKQQQSLLRWSNLDVEKLECAVSRRTHGSVNPITVTRARSHVADQLCHRYARSGFRVCDAEDCGPLCRCRPPSPLSGLGGRSDSPALRRPNARRAQLFQSRNRRAVIGAQSPTAAQSPNPSLPSLPPPTTPWRHHLGTAAASPWMRLQRAIRAHREMAAALGWASVELRSEFEITQQIITRAMTDDEFLDDDSYEDDYGYPTTPPFGPSAHNEQQYAA